MFFAIKRARAQQTFIKFLQSFFHFQRGKKLPSIKMLVYRERYIYCIFEVEFSNKVFPYIYMSKRCNRGKLETLFHQIHRRHALNHPWMHSTRISFLTFITIASIYILSGSNSLIDGLYNKTDCLLSVLGDLCCMRSDADEVHCERLRVILN